MFKANSIDMPPTLTQTITQHLENEIIEGRLEPGTRLVPEELAKLFGVSKSPVREALVSLKEDGLVTMQPRLGFFVSEMKFQDIEEIYAIRAALNALVIKTILKNGYDSDFVETVEDFLNEMESCVKASDTQGYFNHVNQLNDFYLDRCPNSHLRQMVNGLGKKVLRIKFLSLSEVKYTKRSLTLHKELLKALKKMSIESASKNAEEIVNSALRDLREIFLTDRS